MLSLYNAYNIVMSAKKRKRLVSRVRKAKEGELETVSIDDL